jgi:putative transposase
VDLGKASHCVYKIGYHMVLCVKYCKGLVRGSLETFLCEVLKGIGDGTSFAWMILAVTAITCIFLGAAPRYAPSRVMQVMCRSCDMPEGKSVSARMIFERFPRLGKRFGGGGRVLE